MALLSTSACSLQDFETFQSGLGQGGSSGTEQGGSTGDPDASAGQGGTDANGGTGGTDATGGTGGTDANGGTGGTDANGGTGGTDGTGGTGGDETGNLLENGDFEAGHAGWMPFGTSALVDSTDVAHTGTSSLGSTNRSEIWQGPACNILSRVTAGESYQAEAWVRTEVDSHTIGLSLKQVCVDAETGTATETYSPLTAALANTEWAKLTGVLTVPTCVLSDLTIYFEGPPPQTNFYIDDVSLLRLAE